jgi:hypothetical protein
MVKIEWTKSLIVHIKANKDFKMKTSTMSIGKKTGYQVISTQMIPVQAGMEFYFIRSSEEGWYYLLRWSEAYHQFTCSCPSGRIRHCCKHIEMVAAHVVATQPADEGKFSQMLRAAKVQMVESSVEYQKKRAEEISDAEIEELDRLQLVS